MIFASSLRYDLCPQTNGKRGRKPWRATENFEFEHLVNRCSIIMIIYLCSSYTAVGVSFYGQITQSRALIVSRSQGFIALSCRCHIHDRFIRTWLVRSSHTKFVRSLERPGVINNEFISSPSRVSVGGGSSTLSQRSSIGRE